MIPEVTQTIVETLRDQMKTIPKITISSDESSLKPKPPPSIIVFNPDFTVEDSGISGSEPERKAVHEEKFSGDGRLGEFTLSEKPLRPVSVEYPLGEARREPDDYTVDYPAAKVKFRIPPDKGKGNVLVRYGGAKSSAELRSLQLNLKYHILINGQDVAQRDELSVDALRSLVVARELLDAQGVNFRILGGRNDSLDHDELGGKDSRLKRIECLAQMKLVVEMPYSVMEKIIIERRGEPSPS